MSYKAWTMLVAFVLFATALFILYDLFYNTIGLNPFDGKLPDVKATIIKLVSFGTCLITGGLLIDHSR
ncbi:hypothetical protein HG263_10280 [Pseudoalteromonas sp. JBTF-M23]|uniref:Uncharacterized protein n=1 Tax=Pseudoalteromonas caenipelagi TaxID=2726988 RepID=A0A849VGU7_9GAMM|nr:hypothetical protein [Pseudoalteromonas caenipelagi]NOU50917.1 hypothetical protein [Pseudoalteromonas caenipelagi]